MSRWRAMGEVATTGWEEVVLLVVVVRDKGSRGVSADTWLPRRDLVPLEVKVGSLPFGAIRRWFVRSGFGALKVGWRGALISAARHLLRHYFRVVLFSTVALLLLTKSGLVPWYPARGIASNATTKSTRRARVSMTYALVTSKSASSLERRFLPQPCTHPDVCSGRARA